MASHANSRPSPRPAARAPHKVRIIGGQWKRTPLPVAEAPGLRPTPDRVRETVFNWLTHLLGDFGERSFLDLFAGTGALGFEAASRGAGRVVLVEKNPLLAKELSATRLKLDAVRCEVLSADAQSVLAGPAPAFDVIFLDPPFGQDWLPRIWPGVAAKLKPGGLIYVESETRCEAPPGWVSIREDKAGAVAYHLLQAKGA
jgi:16S rRNA (guanine966-N2)-methyltransferase